METEVQHLVVMLMVEQGSLLRLPIKDVMRFGCVSKPWYCRISSCEFSHKYLKFQANNNNKLNLMLHGTHGSFHSISHDYTNCNWRISTQTPIPQTPTQLNNQPWLAKFIEIRQQFEIVGSCDGLLLVAETTTRFRATHAIYIWNPTTRVKKMLPKLVPTPGSRPSKIFGFGRVPTTDNNYKVVFLETISSIQGDKWSPLVFKVHLYTTHTNSWKTLPFTIPFHSTFCEASLRMVLAYDNLHHVAEVHNDVEPYYEDAIISFDLKDDKFRVPLYPRSDQFPLLRSLSALNSGLGALTQSLKVELYCLWMMENFGKEDEHWTKMYCFNNHFQVHNYPLSFMYVLDIPQDGQILIYAKPYNPSINPCVVCYNTNTNRAEILYQDISLSWTRPVVYVESLISPNSTDDRVEGQQGKFKLRRTCFQRCSMQQAFISTSS